MRVLKLGRLESFMNAGWKFHTAASTRRRNSPVAGSARSRTIGTTCVGAIEKLGVHSLKSPPSATNSRMSSSVREFSANLPHMPPILLQLDQGSEGRSCLAEHLLHRLAPGQLVD